MASSIVSLAVIALWAPLSVTAQAITACNPTKNACPPDPALSGGVFFDFTKGSSSMWTPVGGQPLYDANAVNFTITKSGESPQINSNFYIMHGYVEVNMKIARGGGICSSFILQSDDLDEVDWEWVGKDPNNAQSNYFSRGGGSLPDRGATHPDPGNEDAFHTYAFSWSASQLDWMIDGAVVRSLTAAHAGDEYPQTPMQIKIGAWSAGDSHNAPGTIAWSGGPTDYSKGPFTMQVKTVKAVDFSTGKQYVYNGQTGSASSISAVGGQINAAGNVAAIPVSSAEMGSPATPTTTSTSAAAANGTAVPTGVGFNATLPASNSSSVPSGVGAVGGISAANAVGGGIPPTTPQVITNVSMLSTAAKTVITTTNSLGSAVVTTVTPLVMTTVNAQGIATPMTVVPMVISSDNAQGVEVPVTVAAQMKCSPTAGAAAVVTPLNFTSQASNGATTVFPATNATVKVPSTPPLAPTAPANQPVNQASVPSGAVLSAVRMGFTNLLAGALFLGLALS